MRGRRIQLDSDISSTPQEGTRRLTAQRFPVACDECIRRIRRRSQVRMIEAVLVSATVVFSRRLFKKTCLSIFFEFDLQSGVFLVLRQSNHRLCSSDFRLLINERIQVIEIQSNESSNSNCGQLTTTNRLTCQADTLRNEAASVTESSRDSEADFGIVARMASPKLMIPLTSRSRSNRFVNRPNRVR